MMRLASLEPVIRHCGAFRIMDLTDEGWTAASYESRWFKWGEELARTCFQSEEGMLVDGQGRYVRFC